MLKGFDDSPEAPLNEEQAKEIIPEWIKVKDSKLKEEEVEENLIPVEIQKRFQKAQQFEVLGLKSPQKQLSPQPAPIPVDDNLQKEMDMLRKQNELLKKELSKIKQQTLGKRPEMETTSSSTPVQSKKRKIQFNEKPTIISNFFFSPTLLKNFYYRQQSCTQISSTNFS